MTDRLRRIVFIVCGTAIGLVNGFLGGGGGVLCFLALLWLLKLETKEAHATALLVILPITVISALIYIVGGKTDWTLTLPAVIGVALGGIVGAGLLQRLKAPAVDLIFAFVLIAAGIGML